MKEIENQENQNQESLKLEDCNNNLNENKKMNAFLEGIIGLVLGILYLAFSGFVVEFIELNGAVVFAFYIALLIGGVLIGLRIYKNISKAGGTCFLVPLIPMLAMLILIGSCMVMFSVPIN